MFFYTKRYKKARFKYFLTFSSYFFTLFPKSTVIIYVMMYHDRNEDIEAILKRIKDEGRGERRRRTIVARSKTGAIALLCLLAGSSSYFLISKYTNGTLHSVETASVVAEIPDDKPVLRLANDERVLLGESQSSYSIDTGDDVNITTDSDNTVKYNVAPGADLTDREPQWDQVIIQRRGFVRLELADGTTVHINSQSRLEFPRFFNGDKRVVKLTGEAYFEVEHDPSKPFVVEAGAMNVSVLGTSFNLCSYESESNVAATLVEGKVVVSMNNGISTALRPGQQAFVTGEGALATRNVDVAMYTSWMQGKFMFNNARLEEICFQVARWYDTNIDFDHDLLKDVRFTGIMLREKPIAELIGMIEKTSAIRFKRQDGGYIIIAA